MKNLKLFRSCAAISASIVLLSGCSSNVSNIEKNEKVVNVGTPCTHLTLTYGNETVTYKECAGYEISATGKNSVLNYSIIDENNNLITEGQTNEFNLFEVCHEAVGETEIQAFQSFQKIKK